MTDEPELIACPKCGTDDFETPTYWVCTKTSDWGVQCLACGHEICGAQSMIEARDKWNDAPPGGAA